MFLRPSKNVKGRFRVLLCRAIKTEIEVLVENLIKYFSFTINYNGFILIEAARRSLLNYNVKSTHKIS